MIKRKTPWILVLVLLSVIGILVTGIPGGEASHHPTFASRAIWVQPENPHPYLDCWLLQDSDLGGNSPYLLWCSDKTPKERGR